MQNIVNIIKKINRLIKDNYSGFKGVYLYGSFARGENRADSDIDIAAIFPAPLILSERMKLWELISKIEAEYNIILDIHPMSDKELEKNPVFYNQIVNKGIFYGA